MLNHIRLIACLLLLTAGAASSPAQAKTASGLYQAKFTAAAQLERDNHLFLLEKIVSNMMSVSGKLFTQQDTYPGARLEPFTLHKYLYANVDPANMVDPSGKFSLGQMMAAVSIVGTLSSSSSGNYSNFINALITDADTYESRYRGDSRRLMLVNEFKTSIPTASLLGELYAVDAFVSLVRTGGTWDYKNRSAYHDLPEVEAFGNFAFGATAAAWADGFMGGISNGVPNLTVNLMQRGAGYYQEKHQSQNYRLSYGHWYDLLNPNSSYGDNPRDKANIEMGAWYYFRNNNTLIP